MIALLSGGVVAKKKDVCFFYSIATTDKPYTTHGHDPIGATTTIMGLFEFRVFAFCLYFIV